MSTDREPASSAAAVAESVPRSAWIALYLTSVGQAVVILQTSVVNIAFPSIEESFPGTPRTTLAWVITGYAIGSAALLLLAGRLADIYGRRLVFFVGVGIFSMASLGAGLSPSPEWLIASRVVQSFGGALMVPTSLSLVLPLFPASRRSAVVGVWAAIAAIAGAAGPPLGAGIIEIASWRWIFVINVPIGLAIVVIGLRILEENRGDRADVNIDLIAVPLGTLAIALVTLGMLQGNRWGWLDAATLGCFVVSMALLVIVVRRSARHPEPLLDLALFRHRPFSVASAVLLVFNLSVSGFWFAAPLYFQNVWGWSPLQAGLGVTPSPIAIFVFSRFAGRSADGGKLAFGIVGGMIATASAMAALVVFLDTEPNYWTGYFPWAVLYGIGLAYSWSMLTSASLVGIAEERYGSANGTGLTARTIGGALGVALVIAIVGPGLEATNEVFQRVWIALGLVFVVAGAAFWFLYPRRAATS